MQVRSLGQEDPLEEQMATRLRTLAWKMYGQGSLANYNPINRSVTSSDTGLIGKRR